MRPRRGGPPEAIGALLRGVLSDLGEGETARVLRIAERWEEAVGPEIAAHCRPTALRAGVLEARVDSSVWCQQLTMRRPEMVAALHRLLGDDAPTDVRFQVGGAELFGADAGR